MSGYDLIYASLLLGAFVLCAGGYGVFYTLARMQSQLPAQQVRAARGWLRGAQSCYVLQWLATLALVATTSLGAGWKLLIVASCLATLRIPQVTWKYLELIHK